MAKLTIIPLLVLLLSICILTILLKIKEPFDTTKWAIVQYDDRKLSKEYEKLVKLNEEYCKKHNYDHYLLISGYNHVPPYWAKIFACRDILNKKDKNNNYIYDGILWLDTDAVVHNQNVLLHTVSNKDFFCSPDPPLWNGKLNAGVFGLKNSTYGRKICDYWLELYDNIKSEWRKENNKWISSGGWAGDTYEQGSFVDNILENNKYKNHIDILPYTRLQGIDVNKEQDVFVLHFSGSRNKELNDYLDNLKNINK